MTDEKKRKDPGDAVREGVRSVIGILGALKDAVEETFEELRTRGEAAPDEGGDAAESTFKAAQDVVEDVRERLDFVTRRDFEALQRQVAELSKRMDALGAPPANAGGTADAAGAEDAPEEGGESDPDTEDDKDFRFEFE